MGNNGHKLCVNREVLRLATDLEDVSAAMKRLNNEKRLSRQCMEGFAGIAGSAVPPETLSTVNYFI